jgi:hypothetical protein
LSLSGAFWYGIDYLKIFKGRRAHRTLATDLIAMGFKAVALPEAPWTEVELAQLKETLKDYYENACVTGTYSDCELIRPLSLKPSLFLTARESDLVSCSLSAVYRWVA